MFYHAYRSYLNHGFPHDEVQPLSCRGRLQEGKDQNINIKQSLFYHYKYKTIFSRDLLSFDRVIILLIARR